MKKLLLSSACLLFLFVALQSCKKEVAATQLVKEITIDTTINSGGDYYLNLAKYGDEGNVATVVYAGDHFSVSELENQTDMFTTIYHYTSVSKYSGTDQVTLSISSNTPGADGASKDSVLIYLNLTIK
jgi:hypothetical protein